MQLLRPLIAWSCFLAFLSAIGVGVFYFNRSRPRCVVEANQETLVVLHLSPDGSRLVTCRWPLHTGQEKKPHERAYQPRLEVFDTWTARPVTTVESFAAEWDHGGFDIQRSRDYRYFAGNRVKDTLLVDWQNGQAWPIELPRRRTTVVTEDTDNGGTREVEVVEKQDADHRSAETQFSPRGRWLISESQHAVDVGTRRLVRSFPGLLGFIQDDRLAVYRHGKGQVGLWDMDKDKLSATLPTGIDLSKGTSISMLASDDGNWIVLADTEVPAQQPHGPGGIVCIQAEVWEVANRQRLLTIGDGRQPWHVLLARNGSRLAAWQKRPREHAVALIDLKGDAKHIDLAWRKPMLLAHQEEPDKVNVTSAARFSPSGKLFAFVRQQHPEPMPTIFVIDAASRQVLWETRGQDSIEFSSDDQIAYCAAYDGPFPSSFKRDARTGELLGKAVWPQGMALDEMEEVTNGGVRPPGDARMTADGRFAASVGDGLSLPEGRNWDWLLEHLPHWCLPSPTSVTVNDTATGSELLRVGFEDIDDILLSEDGGTLVTIHPTMDNVGRSESMLVRVWSVDPHRAYFWAATWSLGVGVVLLLVRRWRMRRKARQQPKAAV